MERAVSAGLRRCCRTNGSRALRCQVANPSASSSRAKCVATAICPARGTGNISTSASTTAKASLPTSPHRSLQPKPVICRGYSTSESSIAGTIGKDEGITEEVASGEEILTAPEHLNEKERQIWEMLMRELKAEKLEVQDISGGCGSMYGIEVVSERFRGLSMLRQQRLVNKVLGEEIKGWHGVQLKTRAP